MKVTSVEIFDIETNNAMFHPVIVRINTDEGISGVGEAGMAYGIGHSAAAGMIKNLAEAYLIGFDPMKTERLWEDMFSTTFWAQGGGPVVFGGMSAIDTALWDIKGKFLGVPVYQLLGGKTNEDLRTYASQIQFGWSTDKSELLVHPEQYAEAAKTAVAEGFDSVKVDPVSINREGKHFHDATGILIHADLDLFYRRVKAIREAVGPEVDIIIELHANTSASSAIQLGRILEEFNCMFYEESVHYINPELQAKVTQNVKIPMAAGERLYTRWGYRAYFEKQSLDVIQPDLGLVGGITEGKKICDYARVYDIKVQVHVCGSPIATAASLQLEAAIPNFIIHEHHTVARKQFMIELCIEDYQPKNGRFSIPDRPGLGIELNDKALTDSPKVTIK